MRVACRFEVQLQYGSIGWSVGATLGFALGRPHTRMLSLIGDGSFQVTAQACPLYLLPCCAVICCAVLCCVMPCHAVLCYAIICHAVSFCAVLCYAILAMSYYPVLRDAMPYHYADSCRTIPICAMPYHANRSCTTLRQTVPCHAIRWLHYVTLAWTACLHDCLKQCIQAYIT